MILIIGGACQGKTEYAKAHFGGEYTIVKDYHLRVKRQLKGGQDPLREASEFLNGNDKCVIISDEVGYGLVPVDAFERKYREAVGRVNCYFAKEAEQVIRVICGIGTKIK